MSRVLVVEDEAHLAKGLSFNLEAEGHSVEVVGDGEAALDRLLGKKESFDAVVLDVMLPGKDGFEVATPAPRSKKLRARADADRAWPSGRCAERICVGRG